MIFDDGPNSYELSYGLPGQGLLDNKNLQDRRIQGIGNNYHQRSYYRTMVKNPGKRSEKDQFGNENDSLYKDENLVKYFNGGRSKKRQRPTAVQLILEEQPHLQEYARQRALVGLNVKRRMIKQFRKAGTLQVKQLCRNAKIAQA